MMPKRYSERYKQIQLLGRGNYGTAYLVVSNSDGHYYVAKKMHLEGMKDKEQESAMQEIEILKRLNSVFIVKYYENFLEEGVLIIIMEYCEEGDLAFFIKNHKKRQQPIAEKVIINWFVQITLGLKCIHSNKILHRDIKSNNIFLNSNGTVKIGDFGISKVLETVQESANTFVGTPYYLSPQVCENRSYGYKSDVWALGCVLYELCTLNYAFNANSLLGLVFKIVKDKVQRIPAIYSAELSDIVMRLLRKNQSERPSITQIFQTDLVKKVMDDFVAKGGNLHVHIPIKGTNIHDTLRQQAPSQNQQPSLESTSASLEYTQTMQTFQSVNYETLTPKQRMELKRQQQIRKQTEKLNEAASKSRVAMIEAKQRKNEELMESGSKWREKMEKQRVVEKDEVKKVIESQSFKKKAEKKVNQIDMPPFEVTKKFSEGNKQSKYIPNYEDIPIATLKTMKRKQQEEDAEIQEYLDEEFQQYEEEGVRLTARAPESDLQKVKNIYAAELNGELPDSSPSPLIKKREEPRIISHTEAKNSKVEYCVQHLGDKKYKQMYKAMKEMKDSGVPDAEAMNHCIKRFGKENKVYLQNIELIIMSDCCFS